MSRIRGITALTKWRDAMRNAETVTFGGSALDRAAHLRARPDEIAKLRSLGKVLPVWRGKPLVNASSALAWLTQDHPALHLAGTSVFLGFDDGAACFAQDISAWAPEDNPALAGFLDTTRQTHPALPDSYGFEDLRAVMAALTPREAELAATAKAILHWHASHGFCAKCGAASDVVQAGWQRNCPSCQTSHFPRTDPVVIMLVTHGNRLLLGRNAIWPEGMYSLLAGFIEPGETIEAAVRREVFEESGIRCGAVRYLASQPWPFPASLMIGCVVEATTTEITVDPTELEEAFWLNREDMLSVLAGQHSKIKPPRKGAIASFLISRWLADQLE
jgi:NAD+ diphosphatase